MNNLFFHYLDYIIKQRFL